MHIYQAHHTPEICIRKSLLLGRRDQGEPCFEPDQHQKSPGSEIGGKISDQELADEHAGGAGGHFARSVFPGSQHSGVNEYESK